MKLFRLKNAGILVVCLSVLASCGVFGNAGPNQESKTTGGQLRNNGGSDPNGTSLFDIFRGGKDNIKVNRFLWTASLEVLDFLPVQTADPFTGLISTGYGRPPGGGTAYRATVLISDPALDARSLNVALQTQRGPVSAETQRAVEDAILTRARQLRISATRF